MEFINEANVENIQNATPYCCKSYDECKHQSAQTQSNHRQQIKSSLMMEHMKTVGAVEDTFKERVIIDAVNQAYQDSESEGIWNHLKFAITSCPIFCCRL